MFKNKFELMCLNMTKTLKYNASNLEERILNLVADDSFYNNRSNARQLVVILPRRSTNKYLTFLTKN